MELKELKATVHTYHDWELRKILNLYEISDEIRKSKVVRKELSKRSKDSEYEPAILNPKVPIAKRLG